MNADYVIFIVTRRGKTWKYLKDSKDWTQTAPTGITRSLSAEQLLSHLLPPLSGDQLTLASGWNTGRRVHEKICRRLDNSAICIS